MGTIRNVLGKTPLSPLYQWLRRTYRGYFFRRRMKELLDNHDFNLDDPKVLTDLSYGWANWVSASIDYLQATVKFTSQAKFPILECGSGLSTIVAGLVAKKHGNTVWSLESSKTWYRRVKYYLEKYQIDSVRLFHCPLVEYGDYSWYDAPLDSIPEKFSVVICDGPSHKENGRRYGLFSVMNQRFAPGGIILFDNVDAKQEQDGLYYWMKELNLKYERCGSEKPFFIIIAPDNG